MPTCGDSCVFIRRRWACFVLRSTPVVVSMCFNLSMAEELPRLLRKLSSDEFSERQSAQSYILKHWSELHDDLETIPDPMDKEARLRLRVLQSRVRSQRFESLLKQLLESPHTAALDELPLWGSYSERVGADHAARWLYRDMLRREPELMLLLHQRSPEFGLVLQHRLQTMTDLGPFRSFLPEEDVLPASVAVLMLIAIETDGESHALLSDVLRSRISFGLSNQNGSPRQETQAPLRRLLSAWIASPRAAPRELRLEKGQQYGLPATVVPARETLQSSRTTVVERKIAVQVLARFGDVEFVPVLVPLLSDPAIVNQPGGQTMRSTRVQDLALVALLRVTGQSPQEYGFEGLQEDEATVYRENSVGFATSEARDAALHRWKRWVLLHHEGLLLGGPDAIGGATL